MSDEKDWKPCPQGTLSDVKNEQNSRENSPLMARRAALGALMVAGATASFFLRQSGPEARPLTCSAAMKMAPLYLDGRLAGDDLASLEHHLEDCPYCPKKLERLRKSLTA